MESGAHDVAVDPVSIEIVAMDHASITVDVGVGAHLEPPSTLRPKSSPGTVVTSKEHLKTMVGMIFDTLIDVEQFYKLYSHEVGFSVRVGQHKKAK